MSDTKNQEVVTIEEGKKPPMIKIHEGPTQPEERVQFNDDLEELTEQADESDEIKPEVNSGFFIPKSRNFMKEALIEANKAFSEGETPVGAVLVKDNQIIAKAHNSKEKDNDLTAHAELKVIREGSQKLGNWRLNDCELYVTLEPCPMCMGAILQSRLKKLVFGAYENLTGSVESKINLPKIFNSNLPIYGGVLEEECEKLLKNFFESQRKKEF